MKNFFICLFSINIFFLLRMFYSMYNELSQKKTGFNLYQSRHYAYKTYSVKTWFLKILSLPVELEPLEPVAEVGGLNGLRVVGWQANVTATQVLEIDR